MIGTVFNVQRYSLHDGPGIRTVVFLKGCPLRCRWCCNPESQRPEPEVEFRESLCRRCGACLAACPQGAVNGDLSLREGPKIRRGLCDGCGKCAEACPDGALRLVGQRRSVADVLGEVLRDAAYYRRSGGGLTLSGGEPLAQPAFAKELLRACHEHNIHTAVETSGLAGWTVLEEVLPFTDLFLYDLKHMDSGAHRRLTGAPNDLILANARRLVRAGAGIILRIPLIPGCNLDEANLCSVADFAASLEVPELHLMPFHQLGKDKYGRLDMGYSLSGMSGLRDAPDGREQIRQARETIAARGIAVYVGG